MQIKESLARLVNRLRYPASLPEEMARDLGVALPPTLSFKVLLGMLAAPSTKLCKLKKWMPRDYAERAFEHALKKECFSSCTLFSYYFNKGWVVVALYFDEAARLRRAYLQCPSCESLDGFDLMLDEEVSLTAI